jgi:RHS repeat-associated protein
VNGAKLSQLYATDSSLIYKPLAGKMAKAALGPQPWAFYVSDHLGNTRLVYRLDDCSGVATAPLRRTLEAVYDYFPYGQPLRQYEPTPNRFRLTGKEHDAETNTEDFGARAYDTDLVRWMSIDPLRHKYAGWSSYNYVMGNPLSLIDPDGRDTVAAFKPDGSFFRIEDDGKKEWSIKHYTTVNEEGRLGDPKFYNFADANDANEIKKGVINRLVFVEESTIKKMLDRSGALNRDNGFAYLKKEGIGGGKFDFSYTSIPYYFKGASTNPLKKASQMLFIPEDAGNVAHNHMNFGNFLFGAAGACLGFDATTLRLGAHYNSIFNSGKNGYKPQFDSADDQLSIQLGAIYGYRFNQQPFREFNFDIKR